MTRTGGRRSSAFLPGWLAFLVLAGHPGGGHAQSPVPTFFRVGTDTIHVIVHLDSLGVYAPPQVDRTVLTTYLQEEGYTFVRTLDGGTLVVTPTTAFSDPDAALAQGRSLYLDRPDLIENAGPLARPPGYATPLVVMDQVIVQFAPGSSAADRSEVEATYDLELLEIIPTDPNLVLYRIRPSADRGYFNDLEAISEEPSTEWAYPDYFEGVAEAEFIPNDTHFSEQWHLKNGSGGDINATFAWDLTLGSADVVLAIMEIAGFDVLHPDLFPNLWTNPVDGLHGWNFSTCVNAIDPCGGPDLASYSMYHGTAVAGLAAAVGNNNRGVTGVCPRCRLMLLTHGGGIPAWGRLRAFRYARDNGASVINGSWQGFYDPMLAAEITDIVSNYGIPVVLSSGSFPPNTDVCGVSPPTSLASVSEAFSVGATNRQDLRRSWSNFGSCLDLVAPGSELTAAKGVVTTDSNPGNLLHPECQPDLSDTAYTRCFGGTSASAPLVTGTIGLMLSVDPTLPPTEIYDILRQTAEKVSCADALYGGTAACPATWTDRSDTYGYGRLDAFAAVQAAIPTIECPVCPADEESTSGLELGARAGWTSMAGTTDEDAINGPGSGPASRPVFHLAWLANPWMWELQFGWDRRSTGSPPLDTSNLVAALRVAYVMSFGGLGTYYFGPDFAVQRIDDAVGPILTDTAAGVAFGRRFTPSNYMSVHLESRYRRWGTRSIDEWGISLGFAVRLP